MKESSSNNKLIAKNTIVLYIRSIFLLLVSLYTSRVTLQVLGIDDFGIFTLVTGVVQMFSLLKGALSGASQRYITYALGENNMEKLKKVFSTSMTIHVLMGLAMVVLLETLGLWFLYNSLNIPVERLDVANIVMQCAIVSFFFNMISVPYDALINAHERMTAFAYIGILEAVLKLLSAVVLTFIVSYDKLIIFSILSLGIAVLLRVIYNAYCKKNFEEARSVKYSIDKSLFRQMFAFSGWNLIGEGSLLLRNQGIDILLNIFFGVAFNAAKGICNQVQGAIFQFISNFQAAVRPQLTKSIAQKEYERTYDLIMQGSRFSFYLMTFFSIPIFVNIEDILGLWLTEVPPYSVELIRWTLVYLLWDTLSRFLIHAILSTGDIRNYQLLAGGTKLLAIPLAYVCLLLGASPVIGVIVNIVLEIVCFVERLFFSKKQIGFPAAKYVLLTMHRCWLLFAVGLFITMLFDVFVSSSVWISFPFSLGMTVLFIWATGLKREERVMIQQKITNIAKSKLK